MRRAARIDANQNPIVKGLRDIFGPDCIFDLSKVGKGCPDILFSARRVNLLLEIKTDKARPVAMETFLRRRQVALIGFYF